MTVVSLKQISSSYQPHEHYNATNLAVKNFIEALPSVVKNHVLKVGDAIEVPYEYSLLGALSCSSICIGSTITLKDGARKIFANLYIVVVGEQGLGKSPSVKMMISPLREKDKGFVKKYQNDLDELLTSRKEAENKEERQEIDEQIKNLVKKKTVVDDETIENMAIRMLNNPKGLLWFTDELASLLKKQYNGTDVSDYLIKAYDNEPWDIGRKTAGPQGDIHVPIAYLSVISTTQPKTAEKILMTPEKQGNGFISRHLISVVLADDERIPELYPYKLTVQDVEEYNDFMLYFYEKCKGIDEIFLSKEAEELLAGFEFLHKIARQDEVSSVFKGFHGKIGERIRKLALNLHMMQYADACRKGISFDVKQISEEVVQVAYDLAKYLTIEALEKLFGTASESEEDKMREVIIKMSHDGKVEEMCNSDLTSYKIVRLENLFYRTRRRFKQNRELLRETLRNCPNLGILDKAKMQGKNGRWYQTEVFFLSSEMQMVLETEK